MIPALKISPPEQDQSKPRLGVSTSPLLDIGLDFYRRRSRLQSHQALATDGDSGLAPPWPSPVRAAPTSPSPTFPRRARHWENLEALTLETLELLQTSIIVIVSAASGALG